MVLLVVLALVRHLVLRLYVYAKNKLFGSAQKKKKSVEYLSTNSMLKFLFFTKLYNTMELFSHTKIS